EEEEEEEDEEMQPDSNWGLAVWLENWFHCRRSLGPLFFGFGVLAYCMGVWKPVEDWLASLVPSRHGELNPESLKFIVGPTIVVMLSAFFTGGRRPSETFNTGQINGASTACGAFVGQHLLGVTHRSSNHMVAALSIAPAILSFLSAFFDYNHAYVSPLVMTAILGGACVPAWSTVFAIGGLPLDGMAILDLSLFTMAAAMSECYLRKVVLRCLGSSNILTPLATQMMTDMSFSWIADSHLIELAIWSGALVVMEGGGERVGISGECETACQIIRFVNIIAILVLMGQTIVWMQEMCNCGSRSYVAVGIVCLLAQIVYVNELGPMPLIYQETNVMVPPRIHN
ncbi:hypothetical protein PENTCL1PPCAC_22319, partial [Pristionchus entomophagus]